MVKSSYFYHLGKLTIAGLFYGALFIAAYFAFTWFYFVHFDNYTLPTVKQPIEILNENNEIAIGEVILMEIEINKPEDIPVIEKSVDITCSSGNLVTMASLGRTLPVINHKIISNSYVLPPKVMVGDKCQFNFRNRYQPNEFVRTDMITWSSEEFKVVE